MTGTLFLVGTPIGNLGDLSDRARETLAAVDLVAAEDTRRAGRLLQGLGIRRPMRSYFDGNERARTDEILGRLRDGADVALVTDGGMPAVSDPGYRLVAACVDAEIEVRVVPGPSAAIAALVLSGLPTDRFVFEGFAPRRPADRRARLIALLDESRTMVFFESPKRARALLFEIADVMPDRRVALARELTKLHEEVLRGSAADVLERLGGVDPRGEVALVVAGAHGVAAGALDVAVEEAGEMVAGGMRKRGAARAAAERHHVAANDVYRALVGDVGSE